MSHPWSNLEERNRLAGLCRRTPPWRRMAEGLAELKKPLDAYKDAGYLPHRGNATRLARRPEVRALADELMEEAAEFSGVRRIAVINRIDRVGRANLSDFYEADGVTLKNLKALPRELTEALAAIEWQTVGEEEDGTPIRRAVIKLHDKNQANFALLKYFGAIPDDDPTRRDTNIFNILNVDDQRVVADFIEALGRGAPAIGSPAAPEHR